ncbi:MAG: carboxypeptidase-like regulatory domain-containing protein [Planctomycetaceae bacterium]
MIFRSDTGPGLWTSVGVLWMILLGAGSLPSPCGADEILFKDQGVHVGTVIEENDQTVTVQFPRASIQSIVRTPQGSPSSPQPGDRLQEKIDELQKRIERLEKKQGESREPDRSPAPASLQGPGIQEQLFREEMGGVEGVILWQGKPLANAKVRIELVRYTGFSPGFVKKVFPGDGKESSDRGISIETQTDSQGRYTFEGVPPGSYRLYWMPDTKTGWVRRLRENPDLEVISGKRTVQNIPDKLPIAGPSKKKGEEGDLKSR